MCLHTSSGFRLQCCHDPLPQTHCSHGWPYLFLPLISQTFRPDLLVPKYSCICVQHYSWHFSESIRYMHMVNMKFTLFGRRMDLVYLRNLLKQVRASCYSGFNFLQLFLIIFLPLQISLPTFTTTHNQLLHSWLSSDIFFPKCSPVLFEFLLVNLFKTFMRIHCLGSHCYCPAHSLRLDSVLLHPLCILLLLEVLQLQRSPV